MAWFGGDRGAELRFLTARRQSTPPRRRRAARRSHRRLRSLALLALTAALLIPTIAQPAQAASEETPPATPSSVSVTRADGTLTASWAAVDGATSYHVTYSSDGGGSWSLAALNHGGTSITISVSNSATYLVGVRARNGGGDSGWRNSPAAGPFTPPNATPPPGPVGSVSVTRADGSLTASWSAVSGATSYHVTYSSDDKQSWSLAALNHASASITFSVDNSKTYFVGVRARNGGGDSGWTNSPAAAPFASPAPGRSLTFGSHTVPSQSWTKDAAIDTLRLPLATVSCNGAICATVVPEITYTLSPSLPAGASFDAAARTISGTPTAEAASATYTYSAAADGYDAASLTFTVAVAAPGLSFGGATVADQSWVKDTAIDTLTLPAAAGGAGSLTYALSPDLPAGLTFDAAARTITGTPTAEAVSATYRYSASDGTDTATLSFSIEVLTAEGASAQSGLSWVTAPPTLLEWTQGVAVNVTLPAATGDPHITYKLSEGGGNKGAQLPPGISWNASTRTLSGTPTKWFSTRVANYDAYASNKSTPAVNIRIRVSDTSGNHAPYASIKSSGSQLIGQLWSKYGHCYSGSVTYAPSSGHTKHFYDPEDDTLTFTAGSNKLVSTTINSSGYAVATLRHPPLDWYSFHYTATDPDGLYDAIALYVKHFNCKETLSVQENKPKDTVVGSVGGPNRADGSSFSLNGDAATYFDIDSSTGQVTVKDGTTLDYETKTSYSGTFRYSVENTTVGGNIQINVNDVRAPNVDRPTLAQNSTNPTTALDVSWTAPTPMTGTTLNDYDVRYREWTTSSWTEMPDTTNSTATSTTITGLTAGKEYEVQVRASINDEGDGHWSGSSVILYLAENTAVNGNVGGKFNVNATDYYPLQFSLGGTDGSTFKLSTDTGYKTAQSAQIQVKTGNVPDFESKSSYSLTLRAVENNLQRNILDVTYSVLVIVTDVSEPPAAPAAPTVAANSTTPTTKLDVSWTAPIMTGKPAISDYDVQYRKTGDSAWTSHSFTGTGTSTTLTGLTKGKSYEVQVRAVNAEGNGDWSDSGTAITDANAVTRSIAENSAAGTNIGAAVTAKSTNTTYTYTHALSGTDASKFEIGSSTGQITVKTGNIPDYESKTSYSVTVTVTAAAKTQGANAQSVDPNAPGDYKVPVTISVTDVNEPPAAPAAPTVSANSTTPSTKLDVSWTAPAMTGKPAITDYDVQYRQTGTSTWSSHSFTGTTTSTTLTGLTKGKSYEVQVRAVNDEGDGAWSGSGSAITKAGGVTRSVAENSAANANVGAAVTATANPNGYALTHALSGTDASKFAIGASTGQITVKAGTALDYESGTTSYSVTVTVTAAVAQVQSFSLAPNAPGDYVIPVTITVTDVNEPPLFSDDTATRSIAENSSAGTNIGAAVAAGADPEGDTLTYSLTGTDASKFEIGSTTGQITVKSGNIPDYEAKTSYSVTVNVTDKKKADGTADTAIDDTIAVTINVTDVSEPPAAPSAPTVSANSTTPSTKLDVSWTAPAMTGKPAITDYDVQYRLSGGSTWTDASFTGTTTSTTLTGLTKGKSYEVQVRAVNDEGDGAWSGSGSAITKAGGVTRSVAENSAANANVGAAVTATSNPNGYALTHALSGTDASKFAIGASTGQITVASGTSLDYESGTTSYSVTVTVTAAVAQVQSFSLAPNAPGDYVIPVTITVTDVNEPPPAPDGPTVTQNTATPKTKLDVSWTALTTTQMAGKPAVNDYDVQYKKSSDSTWTAHGFTGTGTSTTLTGLDEGTSYDVQVRAVNDEGDGAWSASGSANTQDKNVHAEFPDQTATRSIAENAAAGANVGAAVTATDTEGHTLYYSLNGTDKDSFNIGLNTGQITVKAGNIPDYEAKSSYTLTVEVSDRKDTDDNPDTKIDDTIAVTITVTDVDEPPPAPAAPTVVANATTPSTKLDVSWTAPDMAGKPAISDYDVQYRLSGDSAWTDASFSGTGTSTTLSGLTTGKSYEVQVRAVNAEGDGAWSGSGTAITDADAVTRSVAENSAAGTNVGAPVTATANPNGYDLTHSMSGTDAAKFVIDGGSGQITVKAGTALDYETKKSYSVIVTATAAAAGVQAQSFSLIPNAPGSYTIPVTITVTDVNEVPQLPKLDPGDTSLARSVAENSAAGTNVGAAVTATDPEGDALTYTLTGADASKFDIGAATGQITVAAGTALDYESGTTSYSVTVNVSDGKAADGTADPAIDGAVAVTITVTDVDEPPDKPAAPTVTNLVGNSGSAGQLSVASARGSYLHAAALGANSANSADPTSTLNVSWTAPDMTGKPPITDYDVQYRKSGDSTWTDHPFTGTGTSTTITGLAAGTSYDVQIQGKNDEGESVWSNSGNGITRASTMARNVAENSPAGANVGAAVTATANPNGYALTHSMSGTDAAQFAIDGGSGQITVRKGVTLDYESKRSYRVTVTMTAAAGGQIQSPNPNAPQAERLVPNGPGVYTIPVDISVTNVHEPPDAPDAPKVVRNSAAPASALDVSWTAPDMTGKQPLNDYDVRYRESGDSTWTDHAFTGAGTSTTITGLAADTTYDVQIQAKNIEGASPWSDSGSASTQDENLPAEFPADTAARSIAENSAAGAAIGAALTATDPEGDALAYSLAGTDAASFALDAGTGRLQVKAALDYESKRSYSVTVSVSDGKAADGTADPAIDDTIAVTIRVTDVNEPPAAPAAPKVRANSADPTGALDVSWTAPDMTGKPPITDYDVRYRKSGESAWTGHAFTGTGTSTTITGLTADTSYEVQVRAANDEGAGPWSATATAKTGLTTAGAPPTQPTRPTPTQQQPQQPTQPTPTQQPQQPRQPTQPTQPTPTQQQPTQPTPTQQPQQPRQPTQPTQPTPTQQQSPQPTQSQQPSKQVSSAPQWYLPPESGPNALVYGYSYRFPVPSIEVAEADERTTRGPATQIGAGDGSGSTAWWPWLLLGLIPLFLFLIAWRRRRKRQEEEEASAHGGV